MIISKTPYRMSFFGGGTDYPSWYLKHGGSVLATAIDKYCYISCRVLPPFFDHRYRIVWSIIELVQKLEQIQHPVIPSAAKWLGIHQGLEIHHQGDLPARSGMGSSSSFVVGLLNTLYALKGEMLSREELLEKSLYLEQTLLKENVGSQDQTLAVYGGFNKVNFQQNGNIQVIPVTISSNRQKQLSEHLMLFFSGISRRSSEIASAIVENLEHRQSVLKEMTSLVDVAVQILSSDTDINEFGRLLDHAWNLKKALSDNICNSECAEIYEAACKAGALGGKVMGAGGGGFMMFFVPPERQGAVRKALSKLVHVPFDFCSTGSQIIHYDREDYSFVPKLLDIDSLHDEKHERKMAF